MDGITFAVFVVALGLFFFAKLMEERQARQGRRERDE